VREHLDSLGPGEGRVEVAVDFSEDCVENEVLELLLVSDMPIQGPGHDPEASGEGAHAQRVHTVGPDNRERLGHGALAGQCAATVLLDERRGEPKLV
jgi:hypothetical protein